MASTEKHSEATSRKILPHFRSTNCFDTATHKHKIRRDLSTISNYYLLSQRKQSNDLTHTPRQESTSLLDSLPDINNKRQAQKRSSFLEMWLQEALDPQQGKGRSEGVQVEKTGPLRTVQKFQIDKKYLKSQNISGEVVEKLYNSLYVYTYGINNTFTELLALTKASEHAEKKIVNSFWRAFIKLLQGCTSFRTAFQVIQESYQKQAAEMKENFAAREAIFQEQRKHFEGQVARLSKRINEQSYTITKLTNQYNIAESTLHLTDQAFNDEVSLRLKFEEKVNAVFTSYEEIRHKYEKLLSDLRLKGEEEIVTRQLQITLRAQLEQAQIRIIQLSRQIKRLQEVVSQRDRQIQLKRQEIYQLTGTVKELNEKRDDNEEHVRKIVLKLDHFREENDRLVHEMAIRDHTVAELAARIKEKQLMIDAARIANQKVYQKYEVTGKQLGQFNAQRLQLEAQARDALSEAQTAKQAKKIIEKEKEELEKQVEALEYRVKVLQVETATKGDCLAANAELIRDLQAVKDKFQRMWMLSSAEVQRMEVVMNEAVRLKEIFEQEITGMKMLLQSRNTQLDEANNKLQNQREVFRSKIASLRQEVNAKEAQILEFHDKQLQDRETVTKAAEMMKSAETEIAALTEQKLKLQADLLQRDQIMLGATQQRERNRELFKDLNSKLQQIGRQQQTCQQDLSNKASVLEQMRGRADKEKDLLRRLLESYREDRQKKSSFVHPMIYEDCRMQIDRNTHKIAQLNATIATLQGNNAELQQKIQQNLATILMLKSALVKSEEQGNKKKQKIVVLQASIKQLQEKMVYLRKETAENTAKLQEKLASFQKRVQQQRLDLMKVGDQLEYSKKVIKTQNESIDKLQDQRKIQKMHHQVQQDEIAALKAEIAKFKQELAAARRTDSKNSARTQVIKRKSTARDQERETGSKGQERQHLETPKQSNHEDTYRSEDYPLKPIIEEAPRKEENSKKVQAKEKIEVRPSTVDRDVQTQKQRQKQKQKQKEKEKPKFSHSFKFQQLRPVMQSFGCQVDLLASNTHNVAHNSGGSHSLQKGRIESQQFKRALKLTYMRR